MMFPVFMRPVIAIAVLFAMAQAADPRAEPASAVRYALTLLEQKKYAEFIRACATPDELAALVKRHGSVEKAGDVYGSSERPVVMLRMLQAATTIAPEISGDGTRAVFRFREPIGRDRSLTLQKIASLWYLRD